MYPAVPFRCTYSAADHNTTTRHPVRTEVFRELATASKTIRRRANPYQGRALEKLGHAIEYLVDSRMALIDKPATRADAEAIDILMRLSRCVFSECPEIVPVGQRLKTWMAAMSGQSH